MIQGPDDDWDNEPEETMENLWEEYGPQAYDDDDGNRDTSSRYD